MIFINSLRGSMSNGTTTHLSAVNAQCSLNILWQSLHYKMIKLLTKLLLIGSMIGLTMAVQLTDKITNKQFQGVTVQFHEHPLPQFQWFHCMLNSIYILQTPTNIYDSLYVPETSHTTKRPAT